MKIFDFYFKHQSRINGVLITLSQLVGISIKVWPPGC